MSIAPKSPGVDSPLSMLAAVVSDNPHEQTDVLEPEVQLITLGSIKLGTHSENLVMYVFPYGVYFSLNQLGHVITARKQGYNMNNDLPKLSILKDVKNRTIYLSQHALDVVADEQQAEKIEALANLTIQDLDSKVQKLAKITGLFLAKSFEPVKQTLQVVPLKPHKARFPPVNGAPRKRSLDDNNERLNKKRLSIETKFAEKMENNTEMVDQLKSSYLVKQQQQAIIDQRTRLGSGHPDNSNGAKLKVKVNPTQLLTGIEQLVSPRAEYSSRELPKPRGYEPVSHSAHPLSMPAGPKIPSPQMTAQSNPQNPQQAIPQPSLPGKQQFMTMFEQFYDSMEHASKLQAQLKEQIRKSATLLYTLSSSGQMIEGLVRSHFKEMQTRHDDKFGLALLELNSRLTALEELNHSSPTGSQKTTSVRQDSINSSPASKPGGKKSSLS